MAESPVTRASLLVRLRDPGDREAWQQFVEAYAPVVYGFARKRGLQDADAADLMQDVFRNVAGAAGRLEYDPRRGSFRGWLFTITRNRIYTFLERQRRQVRGTGDSDTMALIQAQPEDEADEWDRDYERRTFAWAAEQIKGDFQESTWQAFWMTTVDGKSVRDVSEQLGLSAGAVYVAKSRVLARLREEIQGLRDE